MNVPIINYKPPKIAQLFVLLAVLLHWAVPMNRLQVYSNQLLGIIVGVAGFGVMIWAWWLFKKFDTAICPTEKTDRLVKSGIYRYSRNPMYLGMVGMLSALAIFVGTLPFYLAAAAYFIVINGFFCPYEENKLTEAFGDEYLNYKRKVRRWF